jgi:anti-sigma B factor antagonist
MPDEVDYNNAIDVHAEMIAALVTGTAVVVADFTHTTFCDTSGIGEIVTARRLATATQIELRLVVPGRLRRIFTLTGLDQLLPVFPTLAAALSTPVPGPAPVIADAPGVTLSATFPEVPTATADPPSASLSSTFPEPALLPAEAPEAAPGPAVPEVPPAAAEPPDE